MTEYESKAILHQIQLERVENGIVRKCLLQLENASRQLAKEIKKTSGVYTKKRYQEIRKYIKDVSKELKANINTDMDIDAFIEYELEAQVKLYKKYGGVNMVAPAKEQVITTATFTPYTATSTFENYLESFELGFFNVWDSQVRAGYINGLTTQAIVKSVMGEVAKDAQVADFGALHQLRNSIQMNTRTALQSFASETRNLIYRNNSELIDGYKWVATLDRRTCIYCGQMESKTYPTLEAIGDTPPAHYNCRCTVIPIIKGYDELDEDDTRASMNGYVDGKITFEEWLENQSADVQKDVLGINRYKMFQNGEKLSQFVSDNRILTIAELKAIEA